LTAVTSPLDFVDAVQALEEFAYDKIHEATRSHPHDVPGFFIRDNGRERCFLWQIAAILAGCTFEGAAECVLRFARGQAPDGRLPEWITPDGNLGGLPENRPSEEFFLDTPTALVDAAWHVLRHNPEDTAFVEEIIPHLGLAIQSLPRAKRTGLVDVTEEEHVKAKPFSDHTPTRHHAINRNELYPSLLFIRACERLADLLRSVGSEGEADLWMDVSEQTAKRVRMICWDKNAGLFRSFSAPNATNDIWAAALAVCSNTATSGQLMSISRGLGETYEEIAESGYVKRRIGGDTSIGIEKGMDKVYSGFASGWMAMVLDFFDSDLADSFVRDFTHTVLTQDAPSMLGPDGSPHPLQDIPALCHALEGIHLLQNRRAKRQTR
jgi:hypothetical protein